MRAQSVLARLAAAVLSVSVGFATIGAQAGTASEFYMKYRAAFDKAKAIEELLPYMSKEMKAQVEETPAAERPKMFEFVKEMSKMSNVKIVKETKTDEGITLSVEATSAADKSKMTGQIRIAKEDGAWKMVKESWSSKG